MELPQGVVIEVRRGGHDALAKLAADMMRLDISGYIRIERRPKELMPRVSQVVIHDAQPKIAIHEGDAVLGGLEALLEIERDSAALDALISLVELPDDDVIRVVNLYPDFALVNTEQGDEGQESDWWNYVQLTSRSWRREARLPEQEVVVEAPEYIRQLTKAKLQKFDLGERYLNYGDTLVADSETPDLVFSLSGLLASHGRPLIVFSRTDALELAKNYSIPESSCWLLSAVSQEQSVAPNPVVINEKVNEFLWANKQAVIMFSDIEYLLSTNSFTSVMKMLRTIIDNVRASDHLLLVHCNLELINTRQRHILQREFDNLNSTYLESLVMDPESIIDHPICMELTDEELAWIQQQVNFSSSNESEILTGNQIISGGATTLVDDDLKEAKNQLNQLVDEWQEIDETAADLGTEISNPESMGDMVEDLVNKAFNAAVETSEKSVEINDDNVTVRQVLTESVDNTKAIKPKMIIPRPATKIKRAKKLTPARKNSFHQTNRPKLTINNRVELPEFTQVTNLNATNQVFTRDLDHRSELMSNALDDMLSSPERKKSRAVYQSINQKPINSLSDLNTQKAIKTLVAPRKTGKNAGIIPSSNIAASDASKRRTRESATLLQSKFDMEKTYHKWSTEYSGDNTPVVEEDYADNLQEAE